MPENFVKRANTPLVSSTNCYIQSPFAIKVDGVCKADDCKERFFAIGGGMWRGDGVVFWRYFARGGKIVGGKCGDARK